jgi:hypothetical protein
MKKNKLNTPRKYPHGKYKLEELASRIDRKYVASELK